MTKITIIAELEFSDDHVHGVSEEKDGSRVIPKRTVAKMVRHNLWSLINKAHSDVLLQRVHIEGQKKATPSALYDGLVRHNEADQDFWKQMQENVKITVKF